MNWSYIIDVLPGLMTAYISIGVVVGTCLAFYFIHKDSFDQNAFCLCFEAVLLYGLAVVVFTCRGLKRLVKYLWTREYVIMVRAVGTAIKATWEQMKKERKFDKELRKAHKK